MAFNSYIIRTDEHTVLIETGGGDKMDARAPECEIVPGVKTHLAPGHNRDMMVVTASSAGRTFCFLSDLVPTTTHLTPTWIAAFDLFPLDSIATKTTWLGRAADENWICGYG